MRIPGITQFEVGNALSGCTEKEKASGLLKLMGILKVVGLSHC